MSEPTQFANGWLPVSIAFDAHPSVVPHALVRWLEFGTARLEEPFMSDSVERLRQGDPPARELDTDLETLLRVGRRLPAVQPAGFIFHISRCGSTLIANALKTAACALVVSESSAITAALLPETRAFGSYASERWERIRRETLVALIRAFTHYRDGEASRLVIKFASLSTLSMPAVRSCFPDVPCVIVVRDPAEVIMASLSGGGWMSLKSSPEARHTFGWPAEKSPEQMSKEEYGGRVIGSYLSAALSSFDGKCMVVDYEDLSEKRMREIAEYFGLELPARKESLEFVMKVYSKDPARRLPFQDDRKQKQNAMSAELRRAARQFAWRDYVELRSR